MKANLFIGMAGGVVAFALAMALLPRLRPKMSDQDRTYFSVGIATIVIVIVTIVIGGLVRS